MIESQSDALLLFGAIGDLAYIRTFPSPQAMLWRGHLHVPIIRVADAGWDLNQRKARARGAFSIATQNDSISV
jgi:glucose-6-phosphate 1-dehydrogenase